MFRLPDFLRLAWVSDRAEETWKPRFEAIRDAWPQVVLHGACATESMCSIRTVQPWKIFSLQAKAVQMGRLAVVLGTRGLATPGHLPQALPSTERTNGLPFHYDVVLADADTTAHVDTLWRNGQYTAAYRAVGMPACCALAMDNEIALQRSDVISRYANTTGIRDLSSETIADIFWQWAHVSPLSYAPCSPDCAAAHAQHGEWMRHARNNGYGTEMDWLDEILSWPLEWTALHGIAELKSPVLKATWATDVVHMKTTLRFHGKGYPNEGATGLAFPFRSPARPLLTTSQAYGRGMANLIQIATATTP